MSDEKKKYRFYHKYFHLTDNKPAIYDTRLERAEAMIHRFKQPNSELLKNRHNLRILDEIFEILKEDDRETISYDELDTCMKILKKKLKKIPGGLEPPERFS